jgi:hypothetical protein
VHGGAEDADTPGGVPNDREDEQSGAGECSGFEEVRGEDGVCLAAQERGPGLLVVCAPLPDGSQPVPLNNSSLQVRRLGGAR